MDFTELKYRLKEIAETKPLLLVGAVVAVIILAAGLFVLMQPAEKAAVLEISVYDEAGKAVEGALVSVDELEISETTDDDGAARFDVFLDREYSVIISKAGYSEEQIVLIVDREITEEAATLRGEGLIPTTQTISFSDASGVLLTGKPLDVALSCSNPGIEFPENARNRSTTSGRISVTPPAGCGLIRVIVNGSGFREKSTTVYGSDAIKLEALEIPRGTVKITVSLDTGGSLPDLIKVMIYDSSGLVDTSGVGYGGIAVFSLPAGSYYAVAEDEAGNYGAEQADFTIREKVITTKEIVLSKEVRLRLSVEVTDETSGAVVEDADVTLNKNGRTFGSRKTNDEGKAVFALYDAGVYNITASKDGYVPNDGNVVDTSDYAKGDDAEVQLELKKCTPLLCGLVKVRVVDEDGLPVQNAKVSMFDADSDLLLDSYGYSYTDRNGYVKPAFRNVKDGSYYVRAFKYPVSGRSETFVMEAGKTTEIEMRVNIGEGTVRIKAFERETGEGIPFADVRILAEGGRHLGTIKLDEKGEGDYSLKADKMVYFIVKAEGYAPYSSVARQILPDGITEVNAGMEKDMLFDMPKIEYSGLFNKRGGEVAKPRFGNSYLARFILYLPSDYSDAGFFIRAGKESLLERDMVSITAVNAPEAWQKRGTTYTPPEGQDTDFANITNAKGKWALIEWQNMVAGVYEIEAEIKVSKDCPPGYELPLFYRAYAVAQEGYLRDPEDRTLGNAEETAVLQSLYAQAYRIDLIEGAEEECSEGFCFGMRITDLEEELYLEEPLQMRIFGDYLAEFSITNKDRVHSSSNIRIRNGTLPEEKLSIESYTITNADGERLSSATPAFSIGPVVLGNYTVNKSISGRMILKGLELGQTELFTEIISSQKRVFSNTVPFEVVKEGQLEVEIKPEFLPAFTPVTLEVETGIRNSDEKADKVLIKATVMNPDSSRSGPFTAVTGADGKAEITLSEMVPAALLIVEAQKSGYESEVIEKEVNEEVLGFEPEELSFALNLTGRRDETKRLTITNLINADLKIKRIYIDGQFYGILDKARMNSWLENYAGNTIITAEKSLEIEIIAALSSDASRLDRAMRLGAELFVEAENVSGSSVSTFIISTPLNINIDLAEMPKEEGCLEVSIKEWKTASLTGRVAQEFYITNNCVTEENVPMELRKLQVKADWKGEGVFGNIELGILDLESGETMDNLPPAIPVIFFERVPAERQYVATVIFTPKNGTNGKTALFDLKIWAELATTAGEQDIEASNDIRAEINIVELGKCIKFTPQPDEGIVVAKGEDEAGFDIDISDCGSLAVEFWLCKGDDECRGGASEGGIKVKPDQFTLDAGNPSKRVGVSRISIPGAYGIPVYVKTPGISFHRIKIYDVLVEPEPDYSFELDKYDFSIKGIGSRDSATLTNNTLSQSINTDATVCDWGDAQDKRTWFDFRFAGIGAVAGAIGGSIIALDKAKDVAGGVAKEAGKLLKNAQTGVKAAKEAVDKAGKAVEVAATSAAEAAAQTPAELTAANVAATAKCALISPVTAQCCICSTGITAENPAITSAAETAAAEAESANSTMEAVKAKNAQITESVGGISKETVFNAPNTASSVLSSAAKNLGAEGAKSSADAVTLESVSAALKTAEAESRSAAALSEKLSATCGGCPAAQSGVTATAVANEAAADSTAEAIAAVEAAKQAVRGAAASAATAASAIAEGSTQIAAASGASGGPGFFALFSIFTVAGFLGGGLLGGLIANTEDVCSQRYSSELTDYVINLAEDRRDIDLDRVVSLITAEWVGEDIRVIGELDKQKIGVIFTNNGIEQPEPAYATFNFRAVKHTQDPETRISRGDDDFGPFNVPDAITENDYGEKFHLRFKTRERIEELPEISLETQSCVSGAKLGVTGTGALPEIKLNWSWDDSEGIAWDSCDSDNPYHVYCDATQFTIALNKRMKMLYEFFNKNPRIECPENGYTKHLTEMMTEFRDFSVKDYISSGCWIDEGQGVVEESVPAMMVFVTANKDSIKWTADIRGPEDLARLLYFKAYLIEDGYTPDFVSDFEKYYRLEKFSDAPVYFTKIGVDSEGRDYGISEIFRQQKISFRQKYYEDSRLPSAGLYQVFINIDFPSDEWHLIGPDGTVNANIDVIFYHLAEPQENSAFYYLPFDGLVGLEGGSFNRQGYGVGFENYISDEPVNINEEAAAVKTYPDSGSNPVVSAKVRLDKSIYTLNTSPTTRGSVLIIEKTAGDRANIRLLPSKATPLLMRIGREGRSDSPFGAFYNVTTANMPVETGSSFTYWTGAGKCLDYRGAPVFEIFNDSPDRAALPTDVLTNWKTAYGVSWPMANYAGDVYLKTLVFTNPQENVSINAISSNISNEFLTADNSGTSVPLNGISGMHYNDPAGGTYGSIGSVLDVFGLVKDRKVCMTNTGRRTTFFWNPAAVYDAEGQERNVEEFANSLQAGITCIGYS
jgi:hypothetical protein